MLNLFYVIFMNLHRAPYMIPKMRSRANHPERYTEEQRYSLVHHVPDEQNRKNYHKGIRTRKSAQRGRIYDVSKPSGKI